MIAAGPGEWRAAWLEDGAAVELHVERGDTRPTGSIHLGRVLRLVAGLEAAFVDIGEERPGFLPVHGNAPDEGARIVVQVRRAAQRSKGALLATRLTSGEAGEISERAARHEPPAQLSPSAGFAAALALRLPGIPDRVCVDEARVLPELHGVFSETEVAHLPPDEWPLDLDSVFDAALLSSVPLPGGGAMHIEETRAGVLIDVDTGSPEAGRAEHVMLAANLAAAQAIARELRLRQLGGGIIVDFAALDGKGRRERVRQALAAALAGDPAKPQLLGWTRLGHIEIVRPRRGRSLGEAMLEACGLRKNATALAFEALRWLAREARANPAANWRLVVLPSVEAVLRGAAAEAMHALEARLGRKVAIVAASRSDRDAEPFDIMAL